MNSVTMFGHRARGREITDLPAQVRRLAAREREVASIVYRHGATTANEVMALLSIEISNGAVRSMLNRLVAKGILKRRMAGAGKTFAYVPGIAASSAVERDFQRLADDYFGGSVEQALNAIDLLVSRHISGV